MKKLALAFVLFSAPAAASDWWVIGLSSAGIAFVDRDSIVRDGDSVIAWRRLYLKVPSPTGSTSFLSNERWDCRLRTVTRMVFTAYNADGAVARSDRKPEPATAIEPDSHNEAVWQTVCSDKWLPNGKIDDLDSFVRAWRNTVLE